jgi:adenosylcobinamide-GDP ribazoletransferase
MTAVIAYYVGLNLSSPLLGVIFAVVIEIFITGGLHLDGLADTFDGIYSNRPKDRVLEIMKDSRLGTNGALAIILLIITKIALIYSIPIPKIYPILMLMPVLARLNLVIACRFAKPARNTGMGIMLIGKVDTKQVITALIISTLATIIYPAVLPGIFILIIFALWYIGHISGKIDGMTGDTLGALCELSELLFLFYVIVFLKVFS